MQAYIKYKAYDDKKAYASKLRNEVICMSYSLKEIIKEIKFPSLNFGWLGITLLKMPCPTTITRYAKSEQTRRKCLTVSDYANSHPDNSNLMYKPRHENRNITLRSISNMTIYTPEHGRVSLKSLLLTTIKKPLTYQNHPKSQNNLT